MNVVAVIPARYSSTRFPGKPLAEIVGKPMIYHVYHATKRASLINEVYVATDDERIGQACDQYGMPWIITHGMHPTGTDRVAEAASRLKGDIFVNVQGDEPMLLPETIDAAVRPLLEDTEKEIAVTNLYASIVSPEEVIDTNTIKVVTGVDQGGVYLSRQPIPYPRDREGIGYFKQVCVYGFRRDTLLWFGNTPQTPLERIEGIELLRFLEHGVPVKFIEVPGDNVAVDTPSDLHRVNKLMTAILQNK